MIFKPKWLRKVIGLKNKKMLNNVSFNFHINVIAEKLNTYAKFEKKKQQK